MTEPYATYVEQCAALGIAAYDEGDCAKAAPLIEVCGSAKQGLHGRDSSRKVRGHLQKIPGR